MPLTSDLTLDASKFSAKSITKETSDFNDGLINIMSSAPRWWEVGAAKYRSMRENGETPLPKPVLLPDGKNIQLPSREAGRSIPCRVFAPKKPKGVFYHIHGGGWVLQTERAQDVYLKFLADECQLTVVSVGYRLAPEDPYPKGNEDCYDVGEYLVDHAEREFGGKLAFLGGESAGGHLSVVTAYHLLKARPEFGFKGLVLNYGCYDLSGFLPSCWAFDKPELVLNVEIMQRFIRLPRSTGSVTQALWLHVEAYTPGKSAAERGDPDISPFYADLSKLGSLPPALFTVGTLDCLMDDSVLLSTRWMMAGGEAVLKVYPGAPHGFTLFPPSADGTVKEAYDDIKVFVNDRR